MLHPLEKASELLEKHGGVQRDAEAEAWREQENYGNQDSEGYKYFGQVALAIVFGRELPPVKRVASQFGTPAPSFTGTER